MRHSTSSHTHVHHLPPSGSCNSGFFPATGEHPLCQERPIFFFVHLIQYIFIYYENCSRNFPISHFSPTATMRLNSIQMSKKENHLLIHSSQYLISPFLSIAKQVSTLIILNSSPHILFEPLYLGFILIDGNETLLKVMNDFHILNPVVKSQSLFYLIYQQHSLHLILFFLRYFLPLTFT